MTGRWTRLAINQALQELSEQDYWLAIQSETEANLVRITEKGLEEGVSNYQIEIQVREQLGGVPANKRSQKIARTEVTGSLNTGHEAAREELIQAGLIAGKTWLTISDEDVWTDHTVLHGETVRPSDQFNVGGMEPPYPGWWGLPTRDRVNCRCATGRPRGLIL